MIFPLLTALTATLSTLLVLALLGGVLRCFGWRSASYWRWLLWSHAGLLVLHWFVTFPLALGYVGSRWLGTRPDERSYTGPRLAADGRLEVQDRESLRAERTGARPAPDPAVVAAAAARAQAIASSDGVTLRVFRLEPRREPPVATVVLVHGLFRSALELEPVAALLREQGCECWLLELRNFGGSSRAPFSLGRRESDDVVAAVQHVRAQPGRADSPLVLFGVSLGTVAVSFALPRLHGIAGVALDAPIEDGLAAARAMLGFDRPGDGRAWFRVDEPWQSLVLQALGWWSDFTIEGLCPADVLATLPADLPVLVVGAGRDDRAPPATVERLFARLPMHASGKQLWMAPDSGHGQVFLDQPAAYAERLRWLLANLRR